MIKRRKVLPILVPRAIWANMKFELACPKCRGKGSVWRNPKTGHFTPIPWPCTACAGRGVPPIPESEIS